VVTGETVTRLRAGRVEDRYGNLAKDWSEADSVEIGGCLFAPASDREDTGAGREGTVVTPVLYCPPGADISATDRVVVRGVTYEADGGPSDWRWPSTGGGAGIEMPLRRVDG